jgi:exopolysaccharide biosynthesis protein
MTLRELAAFFLALGVPEAINLDGGGSTTMVVRDRGGVLRIVNRPSDAAGERPVANALAVVGGCR